MRSSPSGWPASTSPSKGSPPEGAVGIVIPVRDGLKFLKLALYSTLYFTDHPYSLTVVDNQSGLQTRKYLKSVAQNHAINVLRYDVDFNFAAECNLGLKYAFSFPEVRYGLVLNADAVVEPGWLSKLVTTLNERPEYGLVGPVSNIAIHEQVRHRAQDLLETRRLSGFCLLMKREVFEATQGFDATETLFIVCSKTFMTLETLTNAMNAADCSSSQPASM